jgi:O-Antigen ligase
MGLSDSILLQLTLVGFLTTIVFFIAYSLPQKVAATTLILLIPFQPIETRYGTANVALTFVVFIAMLMREKDVRLPLLPQMLVMLFVYFISMSLTHPSTHVQHAMYMFYLISAWLVFWIAYDLTLRYRKLLGIIHIFLMMNVLIIIYCFVQLAIGPDDKFRLFGREEFAMMPVRGDRLTGPFCGVGVIAEYFVIILYLIVHQFLTSSDSLYRRGLIVLLALNFLLLVATGNRGGFLTLIGAGILFLWMFRHLLGTGRSFKLAIGGILIFSISATITVTYTDFNVLFDRLTATEVEEGIPDTRSEVWPMAWAEIKKKPIFGHGPRLRLVDDEKPGTYKGHTVIFYPHNLYLFLLFTVGVTGMIAFLAFLSTPLYRCWKLSKKASGDPYTLSFAKIGIVIMIVIFVDQIKVEFMRFGFIDYWHFVFALLGVIVAVCDRAGIRAVTVKTS